MKWPFKKRRRFAELEEELLVLCAEWFDGQIGDLPADELPPKEQIEEDIRQMRDETYERVMSVVSPDSFLDSSNLPRDEENQRVLRELVAAYAGHESTTPIFVKLALAKRDLPRYQVGWPLCAIRLVAETWAEQSIQ